MKWILKAFAQRAFSFFPFAEELNYFFQKRILKNLPVSEDLFFAKIDQAIVHINAWRTWKRNADISGVSFFEFGAGWDLILPFAFYAMGVRNQTIIDHSTHIRFDLINNTITRLAQFKKELEARQSAHITIPRMTLDKTTEMEQLFGIRYIAPMDASNTGFDAAAFDMITSTDTLEHIPADRLPGIFQECHRILKPGGIFSCIVDTQDHYSYFDRTISIYNYLKFSDRMWQLFNSRINYQNRLRAREYLHVAERAGFTIIESVFDHGNEVEREILQSLKIAPRFKSFPLDELGARHVHLVLQKT